MQRVPLLYTALKDRPKVFQVLIICLFSFFVSIIVVCLIASSTQNSKGDKSKPKSPEVYAGIKAKAAYTK